MDSRNRHTQHSYTYLDQAIRVNGMLWPTSRLAENVFTMIRVSHLLFFQGDDYLRLPVIESYDYLRSLRVPEGIFASSKANGARGDRCSTTDLKEGFTPADFPAQPSLVHYSQHPMSYNIPSRQMSSVSPSPSNPLPSMHRHPYSPSKESTISRSYPHDTALPSIAALTSPHALSDLSPNSRASHPVRLNHPSPSNYSPLSAEDRRVLNSLRVVL